MTPEATEAAIVDLVTSYIGEVVDGDSPLAQQGLDSLAAMELRQKLQVDFRVQVSNKEYQYTFSYSLMRSRHCSQRLLP